MNTNEAEKIIRAWFIALLGEFCIYAPLYKIEAQAIGEGDTIAGTVTGTLVSGACISVANIIVADGQVVFWARPMMHSKGGAQ